MHRYEEDHDRLDCHDWDIIGYPSEFILGDDFYIGEDDMDERWLPINGYEGRYWISDHGRVWSVLERIIMSDWKGNKYGHHYIKLTDPFGRKHAHSIHTLVANAFVRDKFEGAQVLHNEPDPDYNYAKNLHWGTQTDNMRECIEQGRFKFFTNEDREKAMQKRRKPLLAKNFKTGEVFEFANQREAERELGMDQSSIGSVIRGERTHIRNWTFANKGEAFPDLSEVNLNRHRKKPLIVAINIATGDKTIFEGLTRASERLGVSVASISMILSGKMKGVKGWTFRYVEEEGYDE